MLHYMGFFWNRESERQTQAAKFLIGRLRERSTLHEWRQVLNHNGCAVFHSGKPSPAETCHLLDKNVGAVFGTLFERPRDALSDNAAPRAVLGPDESAKILRSGGRELVTAYWGDYAAFLFDQATGRSWILSGPMKSASLKTAEYDGVAIYFTDVADLVRLGVLSFSFNYKQIAAAMIRDGGGPATGLNEVTTVHPGQCVQWHKGKATRSFYWHPLNFTKKDVSSVEEAIAALYAVVRCSVRSWASCYKDIIVSLSGGVDSSIVLASLEGTAARVRCYTHYSEGRMEDERPLAEAAARKANRELMTSERVSDFSYDDVWSAGLTTSPQNYASFLVHQAGKFPLPSMHSAEAFFTGNGGDEVFFRNDQRYGIADRLYRYQFFHGLIPDALNAAIRDARTIYSVLAEAFYDALLPHRMNFSAEAFKHNRLMNKEILEELQRSGACESIWFRSNRDAAPGKLRQIWSLLQRLGGERLFDGPDVISPLRSQLIIELILAIPIYMFWHERKERGLALKSFGGDLTRETLERRWKGGITGYHTDIIRKNAVTIARVIENSPLITEGIFDLASVQKSLSDAINGQSAHAAQLLGAADVAIFFQLWNNSGYLQRPGLRHSAIVTTTGQNWSRWITNS